MKKTILFTAVFAVAALVFSGCTTVESTQKFNRMGLGTPNEKAICQTHVEIPGYFLFGLPIVVGSPVGDGEWTMFRYNLTTETVIFPPFLTKRTIQASGTGVRTKGAALERAASDYDAQP